VHTLPQRPQFDAVVIGVSQPSVSGAVDALQSPKPALHMYEHVVPLQVARKTAVLHATPQAPQFLVEVKEPQPPSPPPSPTVTHAPFSHVLPAVHTAWFFQAPVVSQSWGVAAEHCVAPGTHAPEHVPPLQT
jgi:hypothetical protein